MYLNAPTAQNLLDEALVLSNQDRSLFVKNPTEALVILNQGMLQAAHEYKDFWSYNLCVDVDAIPISEWDNQYYFQSKGLLNENVSSNTSLNVSLGSVAFPDFTGKFSLQNLSIDNILCYKKVIDGNSISGYTITQIPCVYSAQEAGYIIFPTQYEQGSYSIIYVLSSTSPQENASLALASGVDDAYIGQISLAFSYLKIKINQETQNNQIDWTIDIASIEEAVPSDWTIDPELESIDSSFYIEAYNPLLPLEPYIYEGDTFLSLNSGDTNSLLIQIEQYITSIKSINATTNLYLDNVNKRLLLPYNFLDLVAIYGTITGGIKQPLMPLRLMDNHSQVGYSNGIFQNQLGVYEVIGDIIKLYGQQPYITYSIRYQQQPPTLTLDFKFEGQYFALYNLVRIECIIYILNKSKLTEQVAFWMSKRAEVQQTLKEQKKRQYYPRRVEQEPISGWWGGLR